jgi:hypothetical protein
MSGMSYILRLVQGAESYRQIHRLALHLGHRRPEVLEVLRKSRVMSLVRELKS